LLSNYYSLDIPTPNHLVISVCLEIVIRLKKDAGTYRSRELLLDKDKLEVYALILYFQIEILVCALGFMLIRPAL